MLPLGFLFETPICLVDEFRNGNVSPGSGHLAFYRACQARMPRDKRIGAYRALQHVYEKLGVETRTAAATLGWGSEV